MQINNNFSAQNFGKIRIPSNTPKSIRTFIRNNVTDYINPLLIKEMDYLGYDINIKPKYYKTATTANPEELYMHVTDKYVHGANTAYPSVAAGAVDAEQLSSHVKRWNEIMCNYFGITNK